MKTQTVTIAINDSVFDFFPSLSKEMSNRFTHFLSFFRKNPLDPSLIYTKINDACYPDYYFVHIKEGQGGVALRTADNSLFMLLAIGSENEMRAWARKYAPVFENGGINLVCVEHKKPLTHKGEAVALPALSEVVLNTLRIPPHLHAMVLAIRTRDDLEQCRDVLSPMSFEALSRLDAGDDIEHVLADFQADRAEILAVEEEQHETRHTTEGKRTQDVSSEDIVDALKHPFSRQKFLVDPSEKELESILDAPLEKWRVFLHPRQRMLVERTWNGPVKVLGGAGTGKTVVALHRARYLAGLCPPGEKILLTTFTKTLAFDLERAIQSICTDEALAHIEVSSLDRWIVGFLRKNAYEYRICYDEEELNALLEQAMAILPNDSVVKSRLGLHFVKDEWKRIIQPLEITTEKAYLTTARRGRKQPLTRKDRRDVWAVVEEYRTTLDAKGLREAPDAMREARDILALAGTSVRYFAVVVDETQDMSVQALRFLRALVPEGKNDLFLVGDAHQRIYGMPVPLLSCGIDVRGRSKKLRINYRTTEQIRRRAVRYLEGQSFDDLDDQSDGTDQYVSLLQGEKPIEKTFATKTEALKALCDSIETITKEHGRALENICITQRAKNNQDIQDALTQRGIPFLVLSHDQGDERTKKGVRLATMHRIKGLEFDCVFMLGTPTQMNDDPDVACQLSALHYVAASRAKFFLSIFTYAR